MLFNVSIGIVNSINLFEEVLDPNDPLLIGLDQGLCETEIRNGGYGGSWKNVGAIGYKCYFANSQQEMSREFIDAQGALLQKRETLLTPNQDPGLFGSLGGLLGSFGNAVSVIAGEGGLFDIFFNSMAFPSNYLLSLWPCTDIGYYAEGKGVDKFSLNTVWGGVYNPALDDNNDGIITISEAPCITNSGVDGFENITGLIQNVMYILYIIFVIQLIANRGFRGMT